MKKITTIAAALVLSFALVSPALADSTVHVTADNGSSVTPSGTVVVPTGVTQTFTATANPGSHITNVAFDGSNLGTVGSVGFTGIDLDGTDHFLSVTSVGDGGGSMPVCSGPMAPGWNVSLPGGGCGGNLQLAAGATLVVNGVTYDCPKWFHDGCQIPRTK